jgi:hypothetical protein
MSMKPAELSRKDGVIFAATARGIVTTLGSASKRQSCDAWEPQSHASAAIDGERRRRHRTDHRAGLRTEPTPATADAAGSCCESGPFHRDRVLHGHNNGGRNEGHRWHRRCRSESVATSYGDQVGWPRRPIQRDLHRHGYRAGHSRPSTGSVSPRLRRSGSIRPPISPSRDRAVSFPVLAARRDRRA